MRAWWAILLLLPTASAAPQLILTHDVPDDGTTFLGNVDRFGFALTDDGTPSFHQDVDFAIVQNNTTLLHFSRPAGHDYDAVGSFLVSFPHVGPYEVRATWRDEQAIFTGEVLPAPETTVRLQIEGPEAVDLGEVASFNYSLQHEGLASHTDILVQVLDEMGREVLRTQTHSHADAQSFDYRFPAPGEYTLRFTGFKAFPTANALLFPSVTEVRGVTVTGPEASPLPDLMALLEPEQATPPANAQNRVVEGTQGPLRLLGTYDPYDVVGTGQAMRMTGLVVDAQGNPGAHADFKATLTGPGGVIFESATLHEYDGLFEFLDRREMPGDYTLSLEASLGDWSDRIEMPYQVRQASTDAPAELMVEANDVVGCDTQSIAFAATQGPQAFDHSEVAFTIFDDMGRPVRDGKLHTHASGTFDLTIGGLLSGSYSLIADVQSTDADRSDDPTNRVAQTTFTVQDCASSQVAAAEASLAQNTPVPILATLLALVLVASRRR